MVVTRRQSGKGGSTEGFGSEIGTRENHKMLTYEKRVSKKKTPHSSSPDQPSKGTVSNDTAILYKKETSHEAKKTVTNATDEEDTHAAFGFGHAGGTPAESRVKLESAQVGSKELQKSIENYMIPLHPVHGNLLTACVNASQGNISHRDEQQCTSFNVTEYVEQMHEDDPLSEVDSAGCDSSLRSVRGYKVKPESVDLLTSILDKYGDIGDNCSIGSPTIRSFYMQNICDIVEKLKSSNCILLITKSEAEKMLVFLKDAENVFFNVGWLKKRLNEIYEGKQAFTMLKAPSELKRFHAEQKAKIHSAKQKTEIYKNEIAIHQQQIDMHQQQIHDLQEKIKTANAEVSVYEEEALNSGKAIAECKVKLRFVVGLKSLDHGLL
ncbi:uncharacterized protein LOC110719695 [Chenopodium quinoa]|uniref:uncharacterized protein LOC110719695 n=1 Tax=Chenopodium quinoa TaxID=63459 RepID=UPI000B77CCA3|nr:uncharacterized protein LOC110719695 [Chenopodium quinoa]